MSQLNVDAIRASNGTGDAISFTASSNTCTANITNNLSNRNLIINGAMQVWQRGTSTTTSSDYQADRFWVVNQGTYARDNSAPDGFQYSAKLTHSSSDMAIGTPLELPATGNAAPLVATNKFTVSFYGKADSGTEDVNLLCRYRNSKFSGTNQVDFTGTGQTFTLTTSWQRFTKTFTIPTVNANNTIISIEVEGIGATAYFTGFQAELGEYATDFEHRSYADELRRCKRYYQQYPEKPTADNYTTLVSSCVACHSTQEGYWAVDFRPSLRNPPSFSHTGNFRANGSGVASVGLTTMGIYHNGTSSTFMYARASSGFVAGVPVIISTNNDNTAFIKFDAEL